MTVGHWLDYAALKLVSVSDTPRLDAEILLSLATGKTRTHFRAWPDKPVVRQEEAAFQNLLVQRLAGRPIAHLSGSREFWSREFKVTPDVLIPRPETELLVELALERIPQNQSAHIADLGTGSGAIAVSLALELPKASITALDLSPAALSIAADNAARLGACNVRFIRSDWFAALALDERFDLIVGNPPYVAENDPHLQQGDVRFEPIMALTSGIDGLDAIRHIVRESPKRLKPGGWLLFEHAYDQGGSAMELLQSVGFVEVQNFDDLQGHGRVSGGCKR
jgi:release factor glutamine methyltransferase